MLPLILPSVPVGAIILGVLIEAKEMAAIPLLFTVVMWPIPAFTVTYEKIYRRQKHVKK